jgi:methyl-accepting chemotaxis protein
VWLGRRIDNEMLQLNAEMERITQFRLESRRLNRPSRLKEIAELRDGFEAMKTGLKVCPDRSCP